MQNRPLIPKGAGEFSRNTITGLGQIVNNTYTGAVQAINNEIAGIKESFNSVSKWPSWFAFANWWLGIILIVSYIFLIFAANVNTVIAQYGLLMWNSYILAIGILVLVIPSPMRDMTNDIMKDLPTHHNRHANGAKSLILSFFCVAALVAATFYTIKWGIDDSQTCRSVWAGTYSYGVAENVTSYLLKSPGVCVSTAGTYAWWLTSNIVCVVCGVIILAIAVMSVLIYMREGDITKEFMKLTNLDKTRDGNILKQIFYTNGGGTYDCETPVNPYMVQPEY
jgi:hypothetical protein